MNPAIPQLDKDPAKIAGMFDAIAGRYDLLNTVLSGGIDRYWRWRAVRSLALTGRETAVDLCTGTADLVVALGEARTRGPGRRRRLLAGHAPARPRQGPIPRARRRRGSWPRATPCGCRWPAPRRTA